MTVNSKNPETIVLHAGYRRDPADWGGLLDTEDYEAMGRMVRQAAAPAVGGCFGILEGGYNQYAPLWGLLNKEASEKLRKGNYERLFNTARQRVRAWESANLR